MRAGPSNKPHPLELMIKTPRLGAGRQRSCKFGTATAGLGGHNVRFLFVAGTVSAHTRSQMGRFFPKGAQILSWVKISMSLPSRTLWSLLGLEGLRPRVMEVGLHPS